MTAPAVLGLRLPPPGDHMLRPETTTDECHDCRTCTPCLLSIHSMCRPVGCVNGPQQHECACPTCERKP